MKTSASAKPIITKIVAIIVIALSILFLFDYYIAPANNFKPTVRSNIHVLLALAVTVALIYVLRDLSKPISNYLGPHMANFLTIIAETIIALAGTLVILSIMHVSVSSLLVSGGIAAIIIGLAISTVVGNLISGMMLFAVFPIRVGDSIFINNVPGRVSKITSIYTSIITESGTELVIPNSALVQGYFLIAKGSGSNRVFDYRVGDHVFLPSLNLNGEVAEINEFYASVKTEKGTLLLPTYSIMTGGIFATKAESPVNEFTVKINKNVEQVKRALEAEGASVRFSSLDGDVVELAVSFKPKESSELDKARLVELAYRAMNERP